MMNAELCLIKQVSFEVREVKPFLQELRDIGSQYGVCIVCLDRNVMAGQRHVRSAIGHAFRSHDERANIARTPEIEILLYAAGTRQTSLTRPFGVHQGMNEAYLCICPGNEQVAIELSSLFDDRDKEDWEAISEEKMHVLQDLFHITDEELRVVGSDRIQDLVCERVALLEVFK